MDKDFFKDIKDRLSNPFFISFIISWLIYNWPIVLALAFYKQAELKLDHYHSFYDLIYKRQSTCRMIVLPGLSAIVYTVAFPWIKSGINLIQASASSYGDTAILKATESGWMPFKEFIDLRRAMKKEIDTLKDLNITQGQTLAENSILQADITKIKSDLIIKDSEIAKYNDKIVSLSTKTSLTSIVGRWNVHIIYENGAELKEKWEIHTNGIRVFTGAFYHITNFVVEPFSDKVVLQYRNTLEEHTQTLILNRIDDSHTLIINGEQGFRLFSMTKDN